MRDAFIARLTRIAKRDPRVLLMTGDLGFGVLTTYASECPRQFINAGVAESNMLGVATGLALDGRIVFVYSIANFPTLRCLEQIRNDAAYHGADVKVVAVGGGFSYGPLGMSHHATEDLAILRSIPQVTILSPGCLWEAEEAAEALIDVPGACYLRLDKSSAGRTNRTDELFQVGKWRTLRDGNDISLIATGGILGATLQAADRLAAEGIDARVISAHTIRPIDVAAIINATCETGGILTVEEHVVDGGLGGLVAETCLDASAIPRAFHRVGLRGGFSSVVGSQEYLRSRHHMDVPAILAHARELAQRAQRVGRARRRATQPSSSLEPETAEYPVAPVEGRPRVASEQGSARSTQVLGGGSSVSRGVDVGSM